MSAPYDPDDRKVSLVAISIGLYVSLAALIWILWAYQQAFRPDALRGVASPWTATNVLLGSLFPLASAITLFFSKGLTRAIWFPTSVAFNLAFSTRIVVLLQDPNTYNYLDLTGGLTASQLSEALAFMVTGLIALWIGIHLVCGKRSILLRRARVERTAKGHGRAMKTILAASAVIVLLAATLRLTDILFGTPVAFLARMLPDLDSGLGILLVMLIVFRPAVVGRWAMPIVVGLFAAHAIGLILNGNRSFIIQWIWIGLLACSFLRPNLGVKPRHLFIGLVILSLVAPSLLAVAQHIREEGAGSGLEVMVVGATHIGDVVMLFDLGTHRLAGLDHLVATMFAEPAGLEDATGLSNVLLAAAGQVLLDGIVRVNVENLGGVWATYFDGLPAEIAHAGSPFGFGFFVLTFRGWEIGAIVAYGVLLGAIVRWSSSRGFFGLLIAMMTVKRMFISLATSGNMDIHVGRLFTEVILMAILLKVIATLNTPTRRRSDVDALPRASEVGAS